MLTLDHLAVAATDLDAGTAWVAQQLGISPGPGGQHARYGTHNTLIGMGDIYLEVIAKDPSAAPTGRATWFGLDQFTGPPRLANWICVTDDMATRPPQTGPVQALQRGALRWDITVPDNGSLPWDGAYPTLIQWGAGVTHPRVSLPDSGCRLRHLTIQTPDADDLRPMIDLPMVTMTTAPHFAMTATFDTPNGPRTL